MANRRGVLLDTSVFIWTSACPANLSPLALETLSNPRIQLYVSVISIWEMQIKHALGKLPLSEDADKVARRYAEAIQVEFLSLRLDHIGSLYSLPPIHRDPFDRMLVAQAATEGLAIVSPDLAFRHYPIAVLW